MIFHKEDIFVFQEIFKNLLQHLYVLLKNYLLDLFILLISFMEDFFFKFGKYIFMPWVNSQKH